MFNKGECASCAGNKCSQLGYHADNYKGFKTYSLQINEFEFKHDLNLNR